VLRRASRGIHAAEFAPSGSRALADSCLAVFNKQPGSRTLLLASHGVAAVGPGPESAYVAGQQGERVMQARVMAHQFGTFPVLPAEQQDAIASTCGVHLSLPAAASLEEVESP
jgi:ribulose-5-phosphate 4-epimerase/fuculose-1-phosphate aldolase